MPPVDQCFSRLRGGPQVAAPGVTAQVKVDATTGVDEFEDVLGQLRVTELGHRVGPRVQAAATKAAAATASTL